MLVIHLLSLHVFLLTVKPGFSAEISVQTGASVILDVQTKGQPKIDFLKWEKDQSAIVTYIREIKQVLYDSSYEQRVEFSTETLSVTLKNMQKTDSGLYRARRMKDNTFLAEYRVSVIDAVSEAPVLTVNSNQSSTDSCTVNFTCRAHNLTLNSTYNSGSCSQKVLSERINTIILNCSEESIICNHSNPVSWREGRINIKQICAKAEKTPQKEEPSHTWLAVGCAVAILIIVAVFSVICFKCKKGAQKEVLESNTLYAQVEAQEMQKLNSDCHTYDFPERIQTQTQEEAGDKRPNTTYCTVGQYKPPPETDHTIYAAVSKQPKKRLPPDDAQK